MATTGGTLTNNLIIDNAKQIRFAEADSNGANFVSLQAPDTLAADVSYTLPSAAPTANGQVLASTTGGVLSWTDDPTGQWVTNGTNVYYDGGNVGIGAGSSPSAPLHVVGSGNNTVLLVESTDADASVGPIIELYRNSASAADDDALGRIDFRGTDDGGNASTFARIAVTALDVTNNTEDARIDFIAATNDTFTSTMSITGGKVGIGTTSPTNELVISKAGSAANCKLEIAQSGGGGGTSEILFSDSVSGRGRIFFDHGSNPEVLNLEAAGTIGLSVTTAGKVGIGTTSPDNPLHVRNTTTDLLKLECNDAGALGAHLQLNHDSSSQADDDVVGAIEFAGKDSSGNGTIYSRIRGVALDVTDGTEDGALVFGTRVDASFGERMRINGAKVGIGAASPQNTVHLNVADSGKNYLQFTNSTTGVADGDGCIIGVSSAEEMVVWNSENTAINFGTNDKQRFRISNGGDLRVVMDSSGAGNKNKLQWVTESPHFDEVGYITMHRNGVSGAPSDMIFATGTATNRTEKVRIYSTTSSTFSSPGNLEIKGDSGYATANMAGAGIRFVGSYSSNASPTYTTFAHIAGIKENTTDNEYGGAITFHVRQNGGLGEEAARFTSAGNLKFPNTHGIDFGASESSNTTDSSVLADYEEGTYIPTVNANLTLNSNYHRWSYTKIGRQVTIRGLFIVSAVSGNDAISCSLPFNAADLLATANAGGAGTMFSNVTGATAGVATYIGDGQDHLRFYILTEGTSGWARMANNDVAVGTTEIYFTHTYFTA